MSKEMIVKMTGDKIKVKGGEYVQDLIRCEECVNTDEKLCDIHDIYGAEFCSLGKSRDEE